MGPNVGATINKYVATSENGTVGIVDHFFRNHELPLAQLSKLVYYDTFNHSSPFGTRS
jgi:hypothetical protein